MTGRLSPNVFFKIVGSDFILWDYLHHRQFSLQEPYVRRILELACGTPTGESRIENADEIDRDLERHEILVQEPANGPSWGWDPLAEIFHVGTMDVPQEHAFEDRKTFVSAYQAYSRHLNSLDASPPLAEENETKETSRLPDPGTLPMSLEAALLRRKTIREFTPREISLQDLSTILHYAFNFVHAPEPDFSRHPLRKTSPSGGNIHSETVYIWANQIGDLAPGIYRYRPVVHDLQFITGDVDSTKVQELLIGQFFAENAAFGIFLTTDFSKSWFKYKHSRGYRSVLLDMGHLSQTFQLCCTALGLGTWLTGAFQDSKIKTLIDSPKPFEHPIFFLAAGLSSGRAIPKEFEP